MNRILLYLLCLASLSSCAVIMATNKAGAEIDAIQSIRTKTQLIALGAEPISFEKTEQGETVEVYRIQKPQGSIARAFMHGLLDVGTAFLWELAGTPIEAALDEKQFYSVKVTFDKDDQIKRIEL